MSAPRCAPALSAAYAGCRGGIPISKEADHSKGKGFLPRDGVVGAMALCEIVDSGTTVVRTRAVVANERSLAYMHIGVW